MCNKIFDKLRNFVIKESAVDDEEITLDTKIEDDLGVTGDDAVDFMIAYSETFNVDVTKFMAKDYFGSERNVLLSELGKCITGNRERTGKTLTVGHLEKGILAGRLDEEVINSLKA
jgi:acyl carrier protein